MPLQDNINNNSKTSKGFCKKLIDAIDSFSAKELLISDFFSQNKKAMYIYCVLIVLILIALYVLNKASVNDIISQQSETTLKIFANSALWDKKSDVPFLKTSQFRDDTLNKLIPVLKAFVQKNQLLSAYIIDNKTGNLLAHSDVKYREVQRLNHTNYEELKRLAENKEVEIGTGKAGETFKTKASIILYEVNNAYILKTVAPILYGKAKKEVGLFVIEEPYDETLKTIKQQKNIFSVLVVISLLILPGITIAIAYYYQLNIVKNEILGHKEGYLGPYKQVKLIGTGGMGRVYEATRILKGKGLGRKVAVKVLTENLCNKQESLEKLIDEAKMVARLGMHRNIVGLYDFGQVKIEGVESFGLEMPFVKGVTLEKIIETYNQEITTAQSLYICLEILNGLGHAHSLKDEHTQEPTPIVHRDISPKNILVSFNGAVLITDFGVAKSDDISSKTISSDIMGTLTNMSPEQANGKRADCRSDIFSAGTILYECVLKKKVYESDDMRALWNLVSQAEIPEITGIDEKIKTILLKSLAKDPEQRYQTALEMMQDIKELINENYQEYNYDEKDMEEFLAKRMNP